eukprot:762509-Hanusia_phi.AAC.7
MATTTTTTTTTTMMMRRRRGGCEAAVGEANGDSVRKGCPLLLQGGGDEHGQHPATGQDLQGEGRRRVDQRGWQCSAEKRLE